MKIAALLCMCAGSLCAGYTSRATVTFSAASGSSTDTNITLAFQGSDAKLKTVAYGGQIQNTVSRVGVTVPADFVLTSDSTCATTTGYNWGIEYYDPVGGSIKGWVETSLTTGAAITPTVCIGNAAVTTYQGGAQGAEFDSYTKSVWHLSDGTVLSAKDFTSNANDGNITGVTAAAGKIDGGGNLTGSQSVQVSVAAPGLPVAPAANFTICGWQKTSSIVSLSQVFGFGPALPVSGNVGTGRFLLQYNGNYYFWGGATDWDTGITFDADSTFHFWAFTSNGTTLSFYRDGVLRASSALPSFAAAGNVITAGSGHSASASGPNTILDEARVSATNRSADWIATEYANQNAPPVIGAFTPVVTFTPTPQSFIF